MSLRALERRRLREARAALLRNYLTTPTCILLVLANVAWRQGTYFTGSLDPTVVGKAAVGLLALVMAFGMARTSLRRWPVSAIPVLLISLYLCGSLIGALQSGTIVPSAILAIRIWISTATLIFLLSARPISEVTQSLVRGMAIVGLVAVVTGIPASISTGRLGGGIPELAWNEVAMIFSVTTLWHLRRLILGQDRTIDVIAVIAYPGLVFLSGSRTGLFALLVSIALMLFYAKRISLPILVGGLLSLPALALFALATPAVTNLVGRGGSERILTFTGRTVAWQSGLNYHQTVDGMVFGAGLSVRTVPVAGQWWSEQILDSTWVSAIVQGGYGGLVVLLLLAVWAVRSAFKASPVWRPLMVGWVTLLLIRSPLESGLFDATIPYIMVMLVSLSRARTHVDRVPLATEDRSELLDRVHASLLTSLADDQARQWNGPDQLPDR